MDSASAALTINPMPSGRNRAGSTSSAPSNAQPGSQPTGGNQPENSSAQADTSRQPASNVRRGMKDTGWITPQG